VYGKERRERGGVVFVKCLVKLPIDYVELPG